MEMTGCDRRNGEEGRREPNLTDVLNDPVVRGVMRVEGVDPDELAGILGVPIRGRSTTQQSGGSPRRIKHKGRTLPAVGAVLLGLMVAAGLAATPRAALASDTPAEFIQKLGSQAFAVLRSGASYGEKSSYFAQVLRQDFDLTSISRFVLGPYWRSASAAQRREFGSLLELHLLRFYGERLARESGNGLQVTGSRPDADGVMVTSQIVHRDGPPIAVDWRLSDDTGAYRITDVRIGGVSMALAERSEFSATIARSGGRLEGLLAMLRQETSGFGSSAAAPYPSGAGGN